VQRPFKFVLLEPVGLLWKKVDCFEIVHGQSIDFGRIQVIAQKRQKTCAPFFPLGFVLAYLLGQQRLFGRILGSSVTPALPGSGISAMFCRAAVQQSPQVLSSQCDPYSINHHQLLSWERLMQTLMQTTTTTMASSQRTINGQDLQRLCG